MPGNLTITEGAPQQNGSSMEGATMVPIIKLINKQ